MLCHTASEWIFIVHDVPSELDSHSEIRSPTGKQYPGSASTMSGENWQVNNLL